MKTKIIILSLISALCLISCGPKPTIEGCQEYIDALKPYYPYSLDEKFVFVNEASGLIWEADAFDDPKGVYPVTFVELMDTYGAKSYGDWHLRVSAYMQEKDMPPYIDQMSRLYARLSGNAKTASGGWNVRIRFSEDEVYDGNLSFGCAIDEIYSMFIDTVIISTINQYDGTLHQYIPAPEGAYARIVKHQGLTDFSVDGNTVWKRVK